MNRTEVLLLDASVWIAAKDSNDRYCDAARTLTLDVTKAVATLDLALYETANVVAARWGQSDVARSLCATISARCGERVLPVDINLVNTAIDLTAEHGLTAYDAAYVAAARRHGWTLVSCDIADLVSKGLAVAPDAADYPSVG